MVYLPGSLRACLRFLVTRPLQRRGWALVAFTPWVRSGARSASMMEGSLSISKISLALVSLHVSATLSGPVPSAQAPVTLRVVKSAAGPGLWGMD